MKSLFLPSAFTVLHTAWSASWIVPGAVWYDTTGKKIDAHGGGVVQRGWGSTWYWIGYSASDNQTPLMYQSTDLVNWENLGKQAPSVTGMWRPKFASPNGSSFWLYGQQDRNALSLSSSQFVGGYSQKAKGLLPPNKYSYSDTGIADHNTVQINKINSDGSIGSLASSLSTAPTKPPGILESDGVYFLIVSGKTGYRANANQAFWSTSLAGPWTGPADIAPAAEKTYNSQNTYEFVVKGTQATTHIYMGDAWDSKGTAASNYVWLPVAVDAKNRKVTLQYHAMWKVDAATGVVSYPATRKRYTAAGAEVSGGWGLVAKTKRCFPGDDVDCHVAAAASNTRQQQHQRKPMVHRLRTGDEMTFRNVTGLGLEASSSGYEWVSVLYTVNDADAGEAYIKVNGEHQGVPVNLTEYNSRAGHHHTVPVRLRLDAGDLNTITLGAVGTEGFEMEVEGLELYHEDE
ncbi:carbohydrate-binding module family 35 protein [Apiospora kogelbergensis]|uniref:carbohydrate-binding module family 35 protein n=1 Tax=Apiospora kogelbergensis TaxID=1337665 RepID=UPI00312F734E